MLGDTLKDVSKRSSSFIFTQGCGRCECETGGKRERVSSYFAAIPGRILLPRSPGS